MCSVYTHRDYAIILHWVLLQGCCGFGLSRLWKVQFGFQRWHFTLSKTLLVPHLIGWFARRLKPCNIIRSIYLPQNTYIGHLHQTSSSRYKSLSCGGVDGTFAVFFQRESLKDADHTSPRPLSCSLFFSAKRRRKSWCKYRLCIRASTLSHLYVILARLLLWGRSSLICIM